MTCYLWNAVLVYIFEIFVLPFFVVLIAFIVKLFLKLPITAGSDLYICLITFDAIALLHRDKIEMISTSKYIAFLGNYLIISLISCCFILVLVFCIEKKYNVNVLLKLMNKDCTGCDKFKKLENQYSKSILVLFYYMSSYLVFVTITGITLKLIL